VCAVENVVYPDMTMQYIIFLLDLQRIAHTYPEDVIRKQNAFFVSSMLR
jgi:hypothetical protein